MPPSIVDPRRARSLNDLTPPADGQRVLYWMSRDQRAHDNWALLYAQDWADRLGLPLEVVFVLTPRPRRPEARHYDFMLRGLAETEGNLRALGIPLTVAVGSAAEEVARLAHERRAAVVVTDFSPLRAGRAWRRRAAEMLAVPLVEVDAHNVIPAWLASDKEEFGAYTFRPKVERQLPEYLTDLPAPHAQPAVDLPPPTDWDALRARLALDESVGPVAEFTPGPSAGMAALRRFLDERLADYATARNDPTLRGSSDLSPWLHYGHLSPQRVAWEVEGRRGDAPEGVKAFLEELVVRRELSDNYCLYQPNYDNLHGAKAWARQTLDEHRVDPRPYLYTLDELEAGETHDPAWNAAQREMVRRGKMHNYMRMYWAKKILEWSATPEEAFAHAVLLNDRYHLDGRDPNGYTGVAWSIGGVHDRPWPARPIYGKIRSMVYAGLAKKFDVGRYIKG